MALLDGYFVLTPGSGPDRIGVAWHPPSGAALGAEERTLSFGGNDVAPAALIAAFESANTDVALEKIGVALWQCLAGGGAGTAWRTARLAAGAGNALRTILDLSAAGNDWKALPWESVWDGGFLTLVGGRPFVRLQKQATGNLATGWPRRIMVVCGEAEGSAISVREEFEAIEDGLWERRREIIIRVEDRPTEVQLFAALAEFRPHVLHFIGHGNGEALIVNAPAPANLWHFGAAHLKTWLDQGLEPAPHLVFLNACRSQGGTTITPQGRRSLTDAFLANGVPAVIGMSGDIEGGAALILSRRFYQEWLGGKPLDVALTVARLEARQALGATKPRQHLLACFTAASTPDRWLSWDQLPMALTASLRAARLGELHTTFVDRNGIRSQIFDAWLREQDVWHDPPQNSGLVVVEGEEKCGKTDAVRLVLKAMHARGWVARCHDLDGPSLDWLEALRLFTTGSSACGVLSDKLPPAKFALFQTKAADPATDPNDADDIRDVCAAWLAGLREVATEAPVALALDRLTNGLLLQQGGKPVLPEYLQHLSHHLFVPLSQPPASWPILIILVMSTSEAEACVPLLEEQIKLAIRRIRVATFAENESKWALRQYFRKMMQEPKNSSRFRVNDVTEIHDLARAQVEGLLKRRHADMKAGELSQFFHRFMDQLEDYRFLNA